MKPLPLLAALLILGCARAPAQNNQVSAASAALREEAERLDLMERIEREVRLPPGADPLSSYSHSYAWRQGPDGVRKVAAYYESLTGNFRGMRRWTTEREFPMIADGGCGVVTFTYDVATHRFEEMRCNGVA
ncbi:hypothetical protein [Allosphingosinicella sp.]|uniref:hypothetical protein n=1 Tax=Allosphingosinicella sp. TaxID=2823234 RepID=UPI003784EC6C